MEILRLFLSCSSGAPAKAQPGDCADGSPCFLLIPAPRLAARRLFQGLAADFVLFLVALALAWLFGTSAVQEATLNPAGPHYKPIQITLYAPRPAKKRSPDVSVSRVKKDEGRRFSSPPK